MLRLLYQIIKLISGKVFLKFILPILFIVTAFIYNKFLGWLSIIAFIVYLAYLSRVNIYTFMGNLSYSNKDMDKALKWFKKAYKTRGLNKKVTISYAYLLLKSGNVNDSERLLSELINSNKYNESANESFNEDIMLAKSNLALVYWKKGKLNEAIALLEEVHNEYKTTIIYGSLGYLLLLAGDLEKALKFNLEAYEYNSTNTIIMDNLGQTYFMIGDYDRAEDIYIKLIDKNPSFPEAYYNYGCLLFKQGKCDEALEMMKKAKGFELTYLSGITREELENKIEEINEFKSIQQ